MLNGIESLKSVDTILFDLDGTLRHNRPSFTQAFYDYAVQLGATDGDDKRRKAAQWTHYYWAQSVELDQDLRQFDKQEEHFWIHYAQRSLLAFDCSSECAAELAPEIQRYMREDHVEEDYVPADVPETLRTLKDARFRIGVLSNRSDPCQDYLTAMGLIEYLDLALVAGEVNSWKPDVEIFRHALQRLHATPESTIYVGDNYYADILGAQNAQLIPVLIDPEGVFPNANCTVIRAIGEIPQLLALR